ncbi:HipA family kinase [Paenibacillus nasutitermitis]|uniref:HipA-like kinase domain-containing protein n=1 Tax=Paenibacillus nasutitermitis TaxID=1652958 RepID=A0A917DWX9_9BACL|nr:HipA family kinase [Paenibacillus nasutitermitis]GGD75532.1 hypothetical protein GCM10010911_36880 [Paenibacillus nasutitermitis]
MSVHALSHIKSIGEGWTLPHLFYCDDGHEYVVKLMNNHQGPGVLANEYIAFRLAKLLDLPAAEYKVVNISYDLVEIFPALKKLRVPAGPHIGCLFAEQAITLKKKVDLSVCKNIRTMAGMIVFDHWIKNWDRYVTGANLLLLQDTKQLLLIDHSNAFCGPEWDTKDIIKSTDTMEVYWGHYYEIFAPYIDGPDPFEPYLSVLEALDRRKLEQAVSGVPGQWKISTKKLDYLIDFLYGRKDLVRGALMQLQDKFPIWSKH